VVSGYAAVEDLNGVVRATTDRNAGFGKLVRDFAGVGKLDAKNGHEAKGYGTAG
jgi:hypothetical protein